MNIRILLALILSTWLGASAVLGQDRPSPPSYIFNSWGTKQGLPQNSVMTMVQTRDGYLWMGTFGGLVRFDGVRFTVFNSDNTPALNSNRIPAVFESRNGDLWIGADGGLTRYRDGVFTTYTVREGLPGRGYWPLCEDRAGNLWLGWGTGLVRYRDGIFTVYTMKDGLPSNFIRSVLEDREGNLWIGTNHGLHRWVDGKFQSYGVREGLADERVRFMTEDREGALWIGTAGGMSRFKDGRVRAVRGNSDLHAGGAVRKRERGNHGNEDAEFTERKPYWFFPRIPRSLLFIAAR